MQNFKEHVIRLTEIELEMIKTMGPQETNQKENQGVGDSFPGSEELVAIAELSISINQVSEEEVIIANELKKT